MNMKPLVIGNLKQISIMQGEMGVGVSRWRLGTVARKAELV